MSSKTQAFYWYQLLYSPYSFAILWDSPTTQDFPAVYCIVFSDCHSKVKKSPSFLIHENNFSVGWFEVAFSD